MTRLPAAAGPWGTVLDWGIVLTLVLCVLIVAGIGLSRLVFRGRQTEATALWLHLLSLGVFPLFLLAVGNFTVLEYAKEERFCGSCHGPMLAYVEEMTDPRTRSMAALHFQHRFEPGTSCYACHADYGLHGTLEAKLTGLRDAYRYVTATYRLPLKMRAPYENDLCLKCHEGAKRFVAEEDSHLGPGGAVAVELRSGRTSCSECHKPAHRIRASPRSARAR